MNSNNSEVLVIGQRYKVFTINGFRYLGSLEGFDDGFLKIFDEKSGQVIFIPRNNISSLEAMSQQGDRP